VTQAPAYFVLSGSQRPGSQSAKVAGYVADALRARPTVGEVFLYVLGDNPLPLWVEEDWQESAETYPQWHAIEEQLDRSDGLVFVVPEWDGMVPPAAKNFLLHCAPEVVGHKPCLVVAVSAISGGALPMTELRLSGYKNNRICYIPEHVLIRQVQDELNAPRDPTSAPSYVERRLLWSLDLLEDYTAALRAVRAKGTWQNEDYGYGM